MRHQLRFGVVWDDETGILDCGQSSIREVCSAITSFWKGNRRMKICEKCGAAPKGEFGLLDYCANCGKNLCDGCMKAGCCDQIPASSGMEADHDEADAIVDPKR